MPSIINKPRDNRFAIILLIVSAIMLIIASGISGCGSKIPDNYIACVDMGENFKENLGWGPEPIGDYERIYLYPDKTYIITTLTMVDEKPTWKEEIQVQDKLTQWDDLNTVIGDKHVRLAHMKEGDVANYEYPTLMGYLKATHP